MSRREIAIGLSLVALASQLPHPSRSAVPAAGRSGFRVFDGLLYLDKPDLQPLGLTPINWVGDFWRAGVPHDQVDEEQVRA